MTRVLLVLATAAVMVGALAAAAPAQQELPRHPHMFVLGVQFDETGEPVAYRRCIDLAANKALPLNAHHANLHTGRAGEAVFQGGNVVVPGAPLTEWRNCEELIAAFFPG